MRGFVRRSRGRWRLDLRANYASLVSNQIILDAMVEFLEEARRRRPGGRLLDLGAGSKPYEPLYRTYFSDCTSVDVPHSAHDTSDVDVMAWADDLPFPDGTFDCVISTEMLEHCPDPAAVMREISRVMAPGARAFVTTPFLIPLHEMPYDFYRYTPSALQRLAEGAELEVVSIDPRGSYVSVWMGVNQMPLNRSMSFLARRSGLPLGHPANPVLMLFVVLPQLMYLALLRTLQRRPQSRIARLHDKLTYYAGGYVTTLEKPQRAEPA
jgi:SAM-dependent methyltransferase